VRVELPEIAAVLSAMSPEQEAMADGELANAEVAVRLTYETVKACARRHPSMPLWLVMDRDRVELKTDAAHEALLKKIAREVLANAAER
jgi:hypothetical protein